MEVAQEILATLLKTGEHLFSTEEETLGHYPCRNQEPAEERHQEESRQEVSRQVGYPRKEE